MNDRPDPTAASPDVMPTLANLKPGAHLCSLYETEEEHRTLLTPFLRQGLERGEKVLYIVDARTADAILAYLRNDGLEVEPFLSRGQLQILTVQEAYLREGAFDPDRMIALLRAATEQAVIKEGYPALRVTGEMTWALRGLPGSERLIEYEAKLNRFFPGSRCLALCQYDRRRFTPEVQLDILATHPIVAVGTELHDNPYYLPPDVFLAKDRSAARLDQWLNTLTERKRAEEQIRLVTRALESAANGVVITDADGTILWVNPAFSKTTGYAAAEAIGRNPRLLKSGKQDQHFYQRLWATIKAGSIWRGELVNRRKDGSFYTEDMTITPVRSHNSEITNFIAIKQDITERKQMERHAQRIEQLAAMGQLLGGVVHELKNPLFVVTGRVQLLKEKVANREYDQLEPDLHKIVEAAQRMGGIAQRFLTMARPIQPSLQVCSIVMVLNGVLDFLSNELMKHRIVVKTEFAADLPACVSDPAQLHQAFLNLVLNAMQAMSAAHGRGRLTVAATLVADAVSTASPRPRVAASDQEGHGEGGTRGRGDGANWIEVRIQDDGPGIAPEHRDLLFEPFFTTKPPGEGTGLGLWTVQMIVQSLKGMVSYETEVGEGTTFIVRLPLTAEAGRGDAAKG
ncbi:MAG: MEDS domain-containing protein [Nitrospirota bacterium]